MTTSALEAHPDLTYEHQIDLVIRRIDLVASVTNQSRFEPINAPTVDRYVAALTDGATFPPIIVRCLHTPKGEEQLVVLSGNHRVRAHIDAGRKTIDAYIVECDDLTALEIAYRDNATHGLPPSDEERIAHALTLVDKGRTVAEASRTVGISDQKIYGRANARKGERRAAELGVSVEFAELAESTRAALAVIKDGRVFAKLVRTVVAHRIGSGPSGSQGLISDVNSQPDVASAMDFINVWIAQHQREAPRRSPGRPSQNPYLQLRMALGQIRGLNPSDTLERVSRQQDRDDLHERLLAGARHLMAIDRLLQAEGEPHLEVVR